MSKVAHASSVSGLKLDIHAVPSPLVASTTYQVGQGGLLLGVRGGAPLSAHARQEGHRDDGEGGLPLYRCGWKKTGNGGQGVGWGGGGGRSGSPSQRHCKLAWIREAKRTSFLGPLTMPPNAPFLVARGYVLQVVVGHVQVDHEKRAGCIPWVASQHDTWGP